MAYTLVIPINLFAEDTGLTLRAQLVNTDGTNNGGLVTTGFSEQGGGSYTWLGTLPSGFVGWVMFTDASGAFRARAAIDGQADSIKTQTDKIANGVNVVGGFVKGNLTIRQGDSYTPTSGQRLKIPRPTGATWPADLTAWTVTLTGKARTDVTTPGTKSLTTVLTVSDPSGIQDLYPDALTATDTAGLAPYINGWDYTIRAVKNSDATQANTLLSGVLSVAPQLTP